MLKLSKKSEYALMAVKYMAMKGDSNYSTAREISVSYNISYELLAKILQELVRSQIISSRQGVKGGYFLLKNPASISLFDVIRSVEPNTYLTDCMKDNSSLRDCEHIDCCAIRNPLVKLQREIEKIFTTTTISNIL